MIQALQQLVPQMPPDVQQEFLGQLGQLPPDQRIEFVNQVLMKAGMGGGGGGMPPPPMPPPQ
jgi:hypothetical protein